MSFRIAITLVAFAGLLSGCKQQGDSVPGASVMSAANSSPNDGIQTAIQSHLAHNGNLRLDSFDMTVKQVTFDGDRAQAQVEFHAKSGAGTMELTYALEKRDGTWSVVESTPGGGNFSHPGLDKTQGIRAGEKKVGDSDVFQVLDKVHGAGPTATAPQRLPPGHPPVVNASKSKQP